MKKREVAIIAFESSDKKCREIDTAWGTVDSPGIFSIIMENAMQYQARKILYLSDSRDKTGYEINKGSFLNYLHKYPFGNEAVLNGEAMKMRNRFSEIFEINEISSPEFPWDVGPHLRNFSSKFDKVIIVCDNVELAHIANNILTFWEANKLPLQFVFAPY